jgi:hypothetical protein
MGMINGNAGPLCYGTIVSTPVKVQVEIEDLQTGCSYAYRGATEKDCVDYFQSMFIMPHQYHLTVTHGELDYK